MGEDWRASSPLEKGGAGKAPGSSAGGAAMRVLIQRMIDTGQERVAQLSEVEPEVLAELGPLLREAIKSGQRVHVGAGWWCRAAVEQERLEAELLPWASGPALVSMTVTPGEGDQAPVLELGVGGLLQAATHGRVTESQARLVRDLARCLAWAWIERQR